MQSAGRPARLTRHGPAKADELRLLVRVARLYHEQGRRRSAIADRLDLSQATVSRLIRAPGRPHRAHLGQHPARRLPRARRRHCRPATASARRSSWTPSTRSSHMLRDIGSAAAFYLEGTLRKGDVIGISSWSATLLAMVDAMQTCRAASGGGGADPRRHGQSRLRGARHPVDPAAGDADERPARLPARARAGGVGRDAPGAAQGPVRGRDVSPLRRRDHRAGRASAACSPARCWPNSGNAFVAGEIEMLRRPARSATSACGSSAATASRCDGLDERVMAIGLDQLQRARRSVGVAGGRRKLDAIRGALAGGWVNVLITDRFTAARLTRRRRATRRHDHGPFPEGPACCPFPPGAIA